VTGRPRWTTWTYLPLAVGAGGLWILGFPLVLREVVAVALAGRVALSLLSRRPLARALPPRLLTVGWAASLAVSTWVVLGLGDPEPLGVLVGLACVFQALWLLGPQGGLRTFLLLLASAVQAIAVAHARPDGVGLVFVVGYAVSLVPALVAFERASWTAARASERGVRHVEGGSRGAVASATVLGAALRLLLVGLPLGAAAYVVAAAVTVPSIRTRDERVLPLGAGPPGLEGEGEGPTRTGAFAGPRLEFPPSLARDPSLVLTVRPVVLGRERESAPPPPGPVYLRSAVYERFVGDAWTASPRESMRRDDDDGARDGWIRLRGTPAGDASSFRIRDVRGGPTLHLPPEGEQVRFDGWEERERRVATSASRDARVVPALEPGAAYVVRSRRVDARSPALDAAHSDRRVAPSARVLEPPPEAESLRRWAAGVVGEETRPVRRAALLAERLRERYEYRTERAGLDPRRPVHDFLLRRRRGHCLHFASAHVLALRALGHPARLAVGFRVTEDAWAPSWGEYLVRGLDAHAWSEVWFEGHGWVLFDPTAPAATAADAAETETVAGPGDDEGFADAVLRPKDEHRRALVEVALGVLPWAGAAGGAALLLLLLRRRAARLAPTAAAVALVSSDAYRRALRAFERRGVSRRPADTPEEFLRVAARAVPEAGAPFARLTRRFEEERYGSRPPDRAAGDAEAAAVVAAVEDRSRLRAPPGRPAR
jgi:transglutaminase-like putative cysteine protease